MANVYLSLSWDDHKRSICSGLGNLQQNGELVDMTLAADGHHVKVHKLIMSLVSPYLKDLIASADCPHPIIFLHNLSFTTLSSLLEYIYTGEVHIRHTELPDFLAAGKALQIKGLIDMEDKRMYIKQDCVKRKAEQVLNTLQKKALLEKINDQKDDETCNTPSIDTEQHPTHKTSLDSNIDEKDKETAEPDKDKPEEAEVSQVQNQRRQSVIHKSTLMRKIQYSVSNQGSLQIIANRFVYTLKYVQRNLLKSWKCVDHAMLQCPAIIYTNENNEIVRRWKHHNHTFHDRQIMRKIQIGRIYAAFNEALSHPKAKTPPLCD